MKARLILGCFVLASLALPASRIGAELRASDFFRPARTQRVQVSPGGEFLVAQINFTDDIQIVVFDTETRSALRVLRIEDRPDAWIRQLVWADSDSVVIAVEKKTWSAGMPDVRDPTIYVVDVRREDGKLAMEHFKIRVPGYVLDALPAQEDQILYVPEGGNAVYKLVLSTFARASGVSVYGARNPWEGSLRLVDSEWPVFRWYVDAEGHVRAAVSFREGKTNLHYRDSPTGKWRVTKIEIENGEPELWPLGFAEDGRNLLVASDRDRDTYGLFEFDPLTKELGRLVYEHPTAQIVDIVYEYSSSRIEAVVYFEAGVSRYHYFASEDREESERLSARFSGKRVVTTSRSVDGADSVVLVFSPNDPGTFHYFDRERDESFVIGQVAPWLDPEELAPVTVYRVESSDGLAIDAFLTRPRTESPPLVVIAHGGPIGVADTHAFNPGTQYLASRGLAILQVNYRGSGGYGRAFRDAGRREWGRAIEDDIDSALEHVLSRRLVASKRICAAGSSYGGYSALMSVIRHPDRFRCVAIRAAPTDIPLLFNSSDFALSKEGRKSFAEIVGNVKTEYDELRSRSPVYLTDRIRVPLQIVHGEDDIRVDVEHAHRLRLMLELQGRPVEEFRIARDEGHGFSSNRAAAGYYSQLADFLSTHLSEENPAD